MCCYVQVMSLPSKPVFFGKTAPLCFGDCVCLDYATTDKVCIILFGKQTSAE